MSRNFLRRDLILFVLSIPWLGGCGYKVASSNRQDLGIKTLAIKPFGNETTQYRIEQIFTRALSHTVVEKTSFRLITDPNQADAVLEGSVRRLTANPVTFGERTFGSTFLVTVSASVRLTEREGNKVLLDNPNHVFREQYQINTDTRTFFSELNPALERLAGDFASSVITTLIESF